MLTWLKVVSYSKSKFHRLCKEFNNFLQVFFFFSRTIFLPGFSVSPSSAFVGWSKITWYDVKFEIVSENYVNLPIAVLRFYWMARVYFEFESIEIFYALSVYNTNVNDWLYDYFLTHVFRCVCSQNNWLWGQIIIVIQLSNASLHLWLKKMFFLSMSICWCQIIYFYKDY